MPLRLGVEWSGGTTASALRLQIGVDESGLFERSDDVASVAYWYQSEPHAPFPDTIRTRAWRRPR